MPACPACRGQLLDHLYGLLDPAESAAVQSHLATCPACAAAATKARGLLAAAAKTAFPAVTFTQPQSGPAVPSRKGEPAKGHNTWGWVAVAVAASVLAVAMMWGVSVAGDTAGYAANRPQVDSERAELLRIQGEQKRLSDKIAADRKKADAELELANKQYKEVEDKWLAAEKAATERLTKLPFLLDVRGPATALPGAPNEYTIRATDHAGQPLKDAVTVEAKLKDSAGKEISLGSITPDRTNGGKLKVPAAVWEKVSAGADVFLSVTAVSKDGAKSDLTENLKLLQPVYTTFLTTDKPMYRPGETVFFRSLTLDQTRFLPPDRDVQLRFEIVAPDKTVLPGSEFVGLARAGKQADGKLDAMTGPDGKALRGIGSGAYPLGAELTGGEYILNVYEVPTAAGERITSHPANMLAVRKFIVNKYTPEKLDKKLEFDGKSYGPGSVVQARFTLKDQSKPLAAEIKVTAEADGQAVKLDVAPTTTDAEGVADIKFTLPKGVDEIKAARVSVNVTGGINETLVRPVPLATRRLTVEFFPEGGDLLAGVPNRVYFRATTAAGKPADVTGALKLNDTEITGLQTLTDKENPGANQGVGAFTFTPEAGKKYAVTLAKPLGLLQPDGGYALPAVKEKGVVLSVPTGVTRAGEPIKVAVTSVGGDRTVLVGAYVRGRAVANTRLSLKAGKTGEASLDLSATKLGGVTRVTVFDVPDEKAEGREDLKELAERLVFRAPAEELKIKFTARKSGGGAATAFVPGAKVDLDIDSRDENDKPKAAVLMAAVVNQSVITMADEKTERLLPTHFMLSGEVQKGEDLEHADFLLTKHPQAEKALDLLLGTQGWRRFAENRPTEFRNRVPAEDADRILLVSANDALPVGMKPALRAVFNEFYPQFENALLGVEKAEKGRTTTTYNSGNSQTDLANATTDYNRSVEEYAKSVTKLKPHDQAWDKRRPTLGLILAGLLLAGVGGIVVARGLFRGTAAGKTLLGVAVAVLLAAGGVAACAIYTGSDNDGWRETAKEAKQQNPQTWASGERVATAQLTVETGVVAPDDANLAMPKDAAGGDKRNRGDAKEGMKMAEGKPGGPPVGGFGGGGPLPPAMPAGPGGPKEGFVPPPVAPPQPEAPKFDPKPGDPKKAEPFAKPVMPLAPPRAPRPGLPGPAMPGAGPAGGMPFPGDPQMDMPHRGGKGGFGGEKNDAEVRELAADRVFNFQNRRNAVFQEQAQKFKQDGKGERKGDDLVRLQQQQAGLFDQFLPQAGPLVVREYAHARPALAEGAERTDFTETLLWQPVIVTPDSGKATVTFSLSDAVSPYRVLVAGHTLDGRIGAVSGVLEVRKPFALDPKLPQEVGSSDKLDVPLVGLNGTDDSRTADVTVTTTGMKADSEKVQLSLAGTAGGRKLVRMTPTILEGTAEVKLNGKAGGDTDGVVRTLTVVPDGFPASGQKSDVLETKLTAGLPLPAQVVPGTMKMKVTVYPNTLSEVQAGLDGLLREPSGCFEQTSTTNYPNVLVLDYLTETNQAKPEVSKRAKELLDRGYGKLTSFECQKGSGKEGYEWFGGTAPPHESLTAYGLLQFTDMARVHPVDASMLARTKKYLIDSKDGNGGFKKNPRALDTFGYAPAHIANAYIVWAVTESERTAEAKSDLTKEVEALVKLAKDGDTAKDPYFVALVANSLLNRGDRKGGEELLAKLAKLQEKDGSIKGATASVTNSTGEALLIETTSMAVLGWLKANETGTYRPNVETACKWIGSKRSGGGDFGSTQSTILALKALIEFARGSKRPAEDGTITVSVNGNKVATKAFTTAQSGPIVVEVEKPEELFKDGKAEVEVTTDAKQAYPCTVSYECRTRQPLSSAECPIHLGTKLSKTELAEGDTVRLDVSVKNLKGKQDGMVTAVVGIPAGLKVPEDLKQLKLLTDRKDGKRGTVSHFEKRGRELVFYWTGLDDKEEVKFSVDLIAEVPGEYKGPASRAYLYYGAEHKHWVEPVGVTISGK